MEKIGFIGLGIMGRPMAINILSAGFPLAVWNRTKSKIEPLVSRGVRSVNSPKEAAEISDVVITMVTDSPDVEKVILESEGVIEGVHKGLTVIDMSTISPIVTRRIAKALEEKGAEMLDAPVSGGEKGAIEGALSIMVGGKNEVFRECLPIFETMGKNIVYVGDHGMGQMVKLCNQVICGLNQLAVCEGIMFGIKAGLDMDKMMKVVTAGAAGSWQLSNIGPKILKGDLEPGFKVKHFLKDLRLIMETAAELRVPLPGTSLVNQLYRAVEAEGKEEKGVQALIVTLEKLAEYYIVK
jgi:3-hydroxyisobutyrate dehydrogenase